MGCIQKRAVDAGEGITHAGLDFKQSVSVVIKRRDSIGRVIGGDQVAFKFLPPVSTEVYTAAFTSLSFAVATCVLPGQNPRGTPEKPCQDGLFVEVSTESFLVGLFDGHGAEGLPVVNFCKAFAAEYYRDHVFEFRHDPSMNLTLLCELCDRKLKQTPEINCDRSGTTAVLAYVNEHGICVGSVGDSRGVLAFLPQKITEEFSLAGQPLSKPKKKETNPYKREILPSRILDLTQMTIDQKPEAKEELQRIVKAGGSVEKAKDGRGVRVGPYRVWKRGANYPGLAMSRSIGDREGEQCGVIATPIVKTFKSHPQSDQFLVIASDGVWDVLDNTDCVNFVERYRKTAQRTCQTLTTKANPRTSNTTIAHLVCEEARLRWLGIVEDEGVMIDDISCVVVEMNTAGPQVDRVGPESPRGKDSPKLLDEEEKETEEFNVEDVDAQPTPFISRNDPKRGSIAAPDPSMLEDG